MGTGFDSIAEQVLGMAKTKGSLQAEVFLLDSQELTIEVAEKRLENLKLAQERGLGLRIVDNRRLGYAFTADLSPGSLEKVVDSALHNAQMVEQDPFWELPRPCDTYPELVTFDEKTFDAPIENKMELARQMETAARSYDKRVTITEKAVYQDSKYRVLIYNNRGVQVNYRGSYCGGYIVVVGQENGDSQTGFGMQFELFYHNLDPAKIGQEAGRKAIRMLGAQRIPSGVMPVVLDPHSVTSFMGVLQFAFSAEAVLKGKSFLQGLEGQTVASPLLTLVDDGTLDGGLGSSPFDGEGNPTSETMLLQNGKLSGFLHNGYTAKKMGACSTGNGVRNSYKMLPEVGTTNLYIKKGDLDPQEILQDIERGLLITDVMGIHTANPISGDFSIGASGILIENGRLTSPVKGVAVAGNLRNFLQDIDAVGNDLTFFAGKGAPTLRLKSLAVSGA